MDCRVKRTHSYGSTLKTTIRTTQWTELHQDFYLDQDGGGGRRSISTRKGRSTKDNAKREKNKKEERLQRNEEIYKIVKNEDVKIGGGRRVIQEEKGEISSS